MSKTYTITYIFFKSEGCLQFCYVSVSHGYHLNTVGSYIYPPDFTLLYLSHKGSIGPRFFQSVNRSATEVIVEWIDSAWFVFDASIVTTLIVVAKTFDMPKHSIKMQTAQVACRVDFDKIGCSYISLYAVKTEQ